MSWARQAGCREDAIQLVWSELKDQAAAIGAHEWTLAFDRKARDLDARKVPRPERVVAKHQAIQREQVKIERGRKAAETPNATADRPSRPARARRATG